MLEGAHGDELKNKMQREKERERGVGGEIETFRNFELRGLVRLVSPMFSEI